MRKKFMAEDYSRTLFLPSVFRFLLWTHFTSKFAVTLQWRIQGRGPGGPPPLFPDQTEARRVEKNFFGDQHPPPYLRVWMTASLPILSQGFDPARFGPNFEPQFLFYNSINNSTFLYLTGSDSSG